MTRSSNLETWIQIAKVAAAAGEMAPFPYIKGIGGCAVLILEAIQKAGKNDEDLLDLAESIGETINLILDAIEEHGKSSALDLGDVCAEFEKYMTYLRDEVNSTRLESRGRFKWFKRFLKRNEVCDTVNGYRKRVHAIKEKFMIRMAIDSRFVISDIKDGLRTRTDALTSAIETSQRHTISSIDKHADSIYKEIHTWGVLQSKKADELSADVQTLKERSSYKGYVRDVLPGDIYLRDCLDYPDDKAVFTRYNADVGNTPKIVCVYQRSSRSKLSKQDVIQQFHIDVDRLIKPKHQNIAQVFGVCRSPDFLAIVIHGTIQQTIRDYRDSLTAMQFLHFNMQLVNDLEMLHFPILCISILNS
ncbi:uncharacterized protein EV420DRAFT_781013 [Desarmillaria tabescens]|uniref:Protein kinase domain-containing protein n=1 Tax=Armillaria tabescens TaxID=1929756 RepID=A0AA39JVN2_ARMTA|nr:uncharacterized protein EV420DRAFT_781013 [Desarmillaria tabescens]KAK0449654.1 hypothetical protein EV420DRAFT_781013 [Desarmillaria tabescens]